MFEFEQLTGKLRRCGQGDRCTGCQSQTQCIALYDTICEYSYPGSSAIKTHIIELIKELDDLLNKELLVESGVG